MFKAEFGEAVVGIRVMCSLTLELIVENGRAISFAGVCRRIPAYALGLGVPPRQNSSECCIDLKWRDSGSGNGSYMRNDSFAQIPQVR